MDFVKEKSFLEGFFGDVRPLSVLELTNLYSNIQRNALGSTTLIGFSQVAKDAKVKKYLVRGRDIAKKHVEVFGQKLKKDNLLVPMPWDIDITESTTLTFSDTREDISTYINKNLGSKVKGLKNVDNSAYYHLKNIDELYFFWFRLLKRGFL